MHPNSEHCPTVPLLCFSACTNEVPCSGKIEKGRRFVFWILVLEGIQNLFVMMPVVLLWDGGLWFIPHWSLCMLQPEDSLTRCLPNFIVKLKLVLPLIKVKMENRLFYFAHTKLLDHGKSHVVGWCKFFQDWDCSPDNGWRHVFRLSSQPQKKKIPFLFDFWLDFCLFVFRYFFVWLVWIFCFVSFWWFFCLVLGVFFGED